MNQESNDHEYVFALFGILVLFLLCCGDIHPNPGPHQNKFTASFTNIRGLRTNWESVENSLTTVRPHIFFLSETFLNNKLDDDLFAIPGYSLIRRDRPDGSSWGGIALYFSDNFTATRQPEYEHPQHEMICLKLSLPGRTVFMFCIYRPPSSDDSIYDVIAEHIDTIQGISPRSEIIVLGDMNAHHEEWLGSKKTDTHGESAFDFALIHNLHQLVEQPTRHGRDGSCSKLDLLLTTSPDNHVVSVDAPLGSSDHCVVTTIANYRLPTPSKPSKRKVWLYEKADWDGMRSYLAETDWSSLARCQDANAAWSCVKDNISDAMDIFIPSRNSKHRFSDKPWFNEKCHDAVDAKQKAYKNWQADRTRELWILYMDAKSECQRIIRRSRLQFAQHLEEQLKFANSKQWWKLVKSVTDSNKTSNVPPLKTSDGRVINGAREKAELLNNTFVANAQLNDNGKVPPTLQPQTQEVISSLKFWPKIVIKKLRNLDTSKASGPDGISATILKNCAPELAPVLSKLFNISFANNTVPAEWKKAQVVAVPKKGSKQDPSNYRPISLLPIISKVMESIISDNIRKHLDKNHLLGDTQYGFREKRSTIDMLAYITQWWNDCLDTQREVRVIALDIKKAFDRVWHPGLLTKLTTFGICGDLHSWISSFLADRQQAVVLDGFISTPKPLAAGVPQGSVLGPLLFLMFINDLASHLDNDLHLFADDSTLHAVIKNPERRAACTESLQRDLHVIEKWASDWCITFNASKTEEMIISRKRNKTHPPLYFMDNELKPTKSITLLGVVITNTLTWTPYVTSLAKKTARRLYILSRSRDLLPFKARVTVYKAYIRPLMEYASPIWSGAGCTALGLLDRLQRKALRLLKIHDPISVGIYPLEHRREVATLCTFYRHFFFKPSLELDAVLPPLSSSMRTTRSSANAHPFCVNIPRSRTTLHQTSYIPRACQLWNTLPAATFPQVPNMEKFKKNVNEYLVSKM